MTYEKINPTNWIPEKEGDFIEGELVQIQHDIGVNKSNLYSLQSAQGVKNVWGSKVLDEKMAFTKVSDKLRITFKGKAEAKKGKNAAKIFEVEVDKP